MLRTLLRWGGWFIGLGSTAFAQSNPYQQTFEDWAAQIRIFEAGELVGDRSLNVRRCGQPCEAAERFRIELKARPPEPEYLLELLKHADAKVRTLALAALFEHQDPKFLPEMHALVSDQAATFPGLAPTANLAVVEWGQTVGQIASGFTDSYSPDRWEEDQQRGYSAAWFRVKLGRATQQTTPIAPARIPRIGEVRREIDRVPEPDRTWILLSLHDQRLAEADPLIRDSELVTQLKSLGHENILRLLRREAITTDRSVGPANSMRLWVLQHARELLPPEDAEFLLSMEQAEWHYLDLGVGDAMISPVWAIAAAELQPANADSILVAASSRAKQDQRATVMLALWRLVGERRLPMVAEWFYNDKPYLGSVGAREYFLKSLPLTPVPKNVALLRALIAGPGFERLGWRELESLARLANANSKMPLVSESEMRDGHFPWFDFRYADLAQAEKQAPEETRRLLAQLEEWRRRLRESFGR